MPSPFPGMNPYVERSAVWASFHNTFLVTALFQIISNVRPDYIVTVGTRMYIYEPGDDEDRFIGLTDVGIHEPLSPGSGGATAVLAPAYGTISPSVQKEYAKFLEIRGKDVEDLITVIELLSPSNKYAGGDHEQYLRKRWDVLQSKTHLVEIDLLRGGGRLPLKGLPRCEYCVIVSRAEERPRVGIWPWNLRDPMPLIPIPLHAGDPDVFLDLKAVLDQVYDGSRYANHLYAGQPEPRLSPDDAAWAAQFLPPARS